MDNPKCAKCGGSGRISAVVNILDLKSGAKLESYYPICNYCKEDLRRWVIGNELQRVSVFEWRW